MVVKQLIAIVLGVLALLLAGVTFAPSANAAQRDSRPSSDLAMKYAQSEYDFDVAWDNLLAEINEDPNLEIVYEIDHAANAAANGLELAPNRVVFFSDSTIETSLLQEDQIIGVDLPQKIQVIESEGLVYVGFTTPCFLAARHELPKSPDLKKMATTLRDLTTSATGTEAEHSELPTTIAQPQTNIFESNNYLTTVTSDADFDTTWETLETAVDNSQATKFFTVDYQANAESAGLDLNPTKLIVFGNPNFGAPVMNDANTSGIDLPLKILVSEDNAGQVSITANDVELLGAKHGVSQDLEALTQMQTALGTFLTTASETDGG